MTILTVDRKIIRQPQGIVKLNKNCELTKDIIFCIPFNGCARDIVFDRPVTLGSGYSISVDPGGASGTASGSAAFASVPLNLSSYTKITVSFWLNWSAYADDDDFAMEFTPTINSNNGFSVNPNSGSPALGYFQFGMGDTSAHYNMARFTRPSASAWHHYMFGLNRDTGATAGCSAYVDGIIPSGFASVLTQDIINNYANSSLYLFSRNNASLFGAGKMRNLVIRGGVAPTLSLARNEYLNPWELYSPRKRTLYFGAAASNYTKTSSLESYLQKLVNKTSSADARLLKQSILKNASFESQLAKAFLKTSSIDSELLKTILKTSGADSKLQKLILKTLSTDSVLAAIGYLRPDSNITQTSFTGGYAEIDETSYSDSDFAYGANNTVATLEVGLSNPQNGNPIAATIKYRVARTNAGTVDGTGNACDITLSLYQGATLIESDTARTVTGTWTEYTFSPNISSVTDWTDVRFRFVTTASGGSVANRRGAAVSWAEFGYNYISTGTPHTITTSINSVLQKLIQKTLLADSRLEKQNIAKITSVNSNIQKQIDKVSNFDSALLKSIQRIVSADSKLLKEGLTLSTGIQAQLSKTYLDYTGLDSRLLSSETISTVIDSILSKNISKTTSIDSRIQKLIAKINSLDSIIQKQIALNLGSDSILEKEIKLLASLDSILINIGAGLVFSSIDSRLKKEDIIGQTSIDGRLSKAVALNSLIFDSRLKKISSLYASIDSLLTSLEAKISQVGLDSRISKSLSAASNLTSSLSKSISISSSLNSSLSKSISAEIDLTSLLNKNISISANLNSLLKKTETFSAQLSSYIILRANLQNSIDSILLKNELKTVSFSAYIRALIEVVDAYIEIQISSIDNTINIKNIDNSINVY